MLIQFTWKQGLDQNPDTALRKGLNHHWPSHRPRQQAVLSSRKLPPASSVSAERPSLSARDGVGAAQSRPIYFCRAQDWLGGCKEDLHLTSMKKWGHRGQLRTIEEERATVITMEKIPWTAADTSSESCWGSDNAKMFILPLPLHTRPSEEIKHTQVAS